MSKPACGIPPRGGFATTGDFMYIRTPRAYCWLDDPAAAKPAPSSSAALAPKPPMLRARQSWPSKAGPLVAIRLTDGGVQVCVRASGGKPLKWLPADKALTPRQARRWASNGF